MVLIASFFLCAIHSSVFAQETGIVRFAVDQDNGYFEILINDTLLVKAHRDTLPVGEYQAKVWSPGYEEKAFKFYVEPGENPTVLVQLKRSEQYIQGVKAAAEYEKKRNIYKKLPLGLTIVSGVYTIISFPLVKKHHTILYDKIPKYHTTSNTLVLTDYKEELFKEEFKYNFWRACFYGGIITTSSLLVTTIITRLHFKKNYKKPEQFLDQSPFQDRVGINIGVTSVGITLRI